MTRLVQVVVDVMGDVFPELKEHSVKIREIIADEEASFGRTLTKVWHDCPFNSIRYSFPFLSLGRQFAALIFICGQHL